MTTRTTKRTVTFSRPFKLERSGAEFPPGRYFIETDEELVDDVSFPVYRRTATMMQLIADPLRPGITETVMINPRNSRRRWRKTVPPPPRRPRNASPAPTQR